MHIDALSILYAQLTCDLLAIAKFLFVTVSLDVPFGNDCKLVAV